MKKIIKEYAIIKISGKLPDLARVKTLDRSKKFKEE